MKLFLRSGAEAPVEPFDSARRRHRRVRVRTDEAVRHIAGRLVRCPRAGYTPGAPLSFRVRAHRPRACVAGSGTTVVTRSRVVGDIQQVAVGRSVDGTIVVVAAATGRRRVDGGAATGPVRVQCRVLARAADVVAHPALPVGPAAPLRLGLLGPGARRRASVLRVVGVGHSRVVHSAPVVVSSAAPVRRAAVRG